MPNWSRRELLTTMTLAAVGQAAVPSEFADEYFDYAPAPKPPQGRWRIYGLELPESILRKVYYENAARLLGLQG